MKKLLSLSTIVYLLSVQSGFYAFNIPKIEGDNYSLYNTQGKKVLIITLPVLSTSNSTLFLQSLDSIRNQYGTTLKIIGVPSIEDGYMSSMRESLVSWYRENLDTSILITEAMFTRKSSGTMQHSLFSWLTTESKNDHFNIDVDGAGSKFLISSEGELKGVLRSQTRINSAAMNRLLNL